MKLTDHVILNFNNNMSTAAVFLDIEKAFDRIWHLGLLYKLPNLQFLVSLIKLISFSYFSEKIQSLGPRSNIYAKGYISRGTTRFHLVPHVVKYIYI
jgi:hypothetical protein